MLKYWCFYEFRFKKKLYLFICIFTCIHFIVLGKKRFIYTDVTLSSKKANYLTFLIDLVWSYFRSLV